MAWYDVDFMERQLENARSGLFGDMSENVAAKYEVLLKKDSLEKQTGQTVSLADALGGKTLNEYLGVVSSTPTYEQVFSNSSMAAKSSGTVAGTAAVSDTGLIMPDFSGLIAALTSGVGNAGATTEIIPTELKRPLLYGGVFVLALMFLKMLMGGK